MRYGSTVRQLQPSQDGVVVNQERFDAAVLAVPPAFAARLLDARCARPAPAACWTRSSPSTTCRSPR